MKTNIDAKQISNANQIRLLKALSEASRLKLLAEISKGEICACELPKKVKKSQPVVSLHLSILAKAGLVRVRPDGSKRFYSITRLGKKVLGNILNW